MSRRRRPSSTRGSPEAPSTMIRVAASRGRSARALVGAPGSLRLLPGHVGVSPSSCGTASPTGLRSRLQAPRRRDIAGSRESQMPLNARAGGLPAAKRRRAARQPARRAGVALALRQHLEAQRAGGRDRLDEAHAHLVAQPIGRRRCGRRQRVRVLVMAPVVVADGGGGHEAVGAGVAQAHEQADARDARDSRVELRSDAVGEKGRRSAGRWSRARPPWRAARHRRWPARCRRAAPLPRRRGRRRRARARGPASGARGGRRSGGSAR